MAVKVMWGPDGPYAIADTPAEALELIKAGAGSNRDGASAMPQRFPRSEPPSDPPPEEQRVLSVFKEINERGRKLLAALVKHPEGTFGENFATEINEEPAVFGGIAGGISKIAKRNNVKMAQLYRSEMRFEGARRYRWMAPGPLLLKYADVLK